MSEKCFCHFNGYEVKDAAARKSIEDIKLLLGDEVTDIAAREAIQNLEKYVVDIVTPQMYGATADGETDDTVAVAAALNSGKKVYFPAGIYLIEGEVKITRTGAINIVGDGTTKTHIRYRHNGRMSFDRSGAIAWRAATFRIEGIYFELTSGIDISFCQFGIIKNCSFARSGGDSLSNRIGINLLNECHYFTIENTLVSGFDTGIRTETSNGCIIKAVYISYCATPMHLLSDYNKISDSDIEGGNGTMKIESGNNVIDNLHLERNNAGNWIEISGSNNILNITAESDGVSYYNPLLNVTGKRNNCTVKGCGYQIMNHKSHKSNKFKVLGSYAPMNEKLINGAAMRDLDIEFPRNSVIYDSDVDGLEKFFELSGGAYWLEGGTIVSPTGASVRMKISEILAENGLSGCYAIFKTTSHTGQHIFNNGASNQASTLEWVKCSEIWYLKSDMISTSGNGCASTFNRIILTDGGTMDQLNFGKEQQGG